jgi:TnpA family transposase
MPVGFLTPDQEARYGRFAGDPTTEQLAQFFWFDDADHESIDRHRGIHNRFGFALQLGTVRFLGTFLTDPAAVPPIVLRYVAQQIGCNFTDLASYSRMESRWDHTKEIRATYGYHDFSDQPGHWRLVRWLYGRAWLTAERPSVLFDRATAWCVDQKILLPGVSVLARLVAHVRDRAHTRLWSRLAALPSLEQQGALEKLLIPDPITHSTKLDEFRQSPTRVSVPGLLRALDRLDKLSALGGPQWLLTGLPVSRVKALARYAAATRAQAVSRMPEERRQATLVAFAVTWWSVARDELLDLLDRYLTDLFARTNRQGQKQRLRTLRDLDSAARQLRTACATLLDDTMAGTDIRAAVFTKVSRSALQQAVATVDQLTRPPDQTVEFQELFRHYAEVRRFLPRLLDAIPFQATRAGQPALIAWQFLKKHAESSSKPWPEAPTTGMTASWRAVAIDHQSRVRPRAYTFWALYRLEESLRRHDLYVARSDRYGDHRAQLLQGAAWDAVRPQVLRTLNWSGMAEESLAPLAAALDAAYRQTAGRWVENPSVRLESVAGRDRLVVSPLDRLEEPTSLRRLRARINALLPWTDLPGLLLEVHQWTGFADAFTHASEGGERVKDLAISVCAVLLAQACNIGLDPVVQNGNAALERDRLTWVAQNYLRSETLTQANAILVAAHAQLPLAQAWGGGEVASADGLRFVAPVHTVYAGPNPKYFGAGRGVTYYNFTSDQFSGFNALVIPGTVRDSLYLLEGLLEQSTVLRPQEIMTDTAGYSDIIFGLFGLLGYQFSPRLADLGETRFWRIDSHADYGVLNGLACHQIRADLVARHWEDMLRVAGSLKLGTVNATHLIQALQHGGRPTLLGRAVGELGRIYKTRYLLAYLNDEGYRRRILTQLNRGEARHSLARAVFYGKRGELHQAYREGQEDQLNALGLVANAIVLWNTRYIAAILDELRNQGQPVGEDDVARLSPLVHNHIAMLGHYEFVLPDDVARGNLRPLILDANVSRDEA